MLGSVVLVYRLQLNAYFRLKLILLVSELNKYLYNINIIQHKI